MNPTATTNTKTSYPQGQTGGLTAQQRAFLWCIGPHCVIPALARSGAGIDELIPPADDRHRSHGGPIHESAIACENGWSPTGAGHTLRYFTWGSNGPRLELGNPGPGPNLVTVAVTRQQLRTYARTLPYELVAELRGIDTRPLRRFTPNEDEAEPRRHADQLLARALDLELPGAPKTYAPYEQMNLW